MQSLKTKKQKIMQLTISKLKYNIKSLIKDVPASNYLTVFDDDIFIVSYPRSGNTWLRFLIGTLYSGINVTWENMEEIIPDIYRCSNKHLKGIKRPRLLKSHHPYDARYGKVIYIIRDPRDVLISFFNFYRKFYKLENTQSSFNSFFNKYINGKLKDFGSWKTNVESWLNQSSKIPNGFIYFRYEDILNDTKVYLERIFDFLNIKRTNEEIENAILWASFDNMRKLENEQNESVSLFKNSDKELSFVRKGKIGNWKDLLNKQQIDLLHNEFGETMQKLGYKLNE